MNQEQENKRLKLKINKLIDALEERDREKNQLEIRLEAIEAQEKLEIAGAQAPNLAIARFFEDFGEIVKKIHQNGEFIPYKNATKYSGSFCKVERNVFEGYVAEIAGAEQPDFISKCCTFGCLKSESGGKCVYNNDRIRVYYLSRQ